MARPLLSITGLQKSYASPGGVDSLIVDIERFSLDPASHVALRGGSGSGKTTFLNLIAGILKPDAGAIHIDGEAMTGASEAVRDRLRARKLGYIFQTFNLLQGYSALENVLLGMMFGRGADRAEAEGLLERVGLADRMQYRPRQLSVGQQQRVAVARALANRPALVLADEPTGNLDRRNATAALDLIREVCVENGAALLLVSHDEEVLGRFDRVEDFASMNPAGREVSP